MSTERFYNYFHELPRTRVLRIINESQRLLRKPLETGIEVVSGPLDYQIEDEEFDAALNKLKTNN